MKACTKCGETKALGQFHTNQQHRDGRNSACKECERKRAIAKYYANREAILERARTPEAKMKRKLRRAGS